MREDLLQLSPEALVLLANRGLVKRATRMLDKGEGPVVDEAEDGTVTATFADGPVVTWPPATALEDVACSCGATTICRHRVCAALAYQAQATAGDTAADDEPWSPGELTDEALAALVGERALAQARRRVRDGLDAEVHRGSQPRVHLPNGTVRFPVPRAPEMVHCDALGAEREVLIALAVWAFREADAAGGEAPVLQVHLHQTAGDFEVAPFEAAERWARVALETGLAQVPAQAGAQLERARADAGRAGWVWVSDVLASLEDQVAAYQARSPRYSAETAAGLIGEVIARRRATRSPGPPSPGWFVGAGVAPEAQLDHLTLTGLGARIRTLGERVEVDVYLLDQRAGAVLVLSRGLDREPELDVGSRRAGSRMTLGALAAGQLTTQGAIRRANRQVRFAGERGVRKHDLKPGGGSWGAIPAPVQILGLEALRQELAERPPSVLRPRLRAEDVRIVALGEVHQVGWRAGAQELVASASMPNGDPVFLRLRHDPAAPGACGALEAALQDGPGFVAGHVRLRGEVIEVEPTAVALAGQVAVPALSGARSVSAPSAPEPRIDPLDDALRAGRVALADLAHQGLGAVDARARSLERASERLRDAGLSRAARRVSGIAGAPDPVAAWVDAWLTLTIATERPRAV